MVAESTALTSGQSFFERLSPVLQSAEGLTDALAANFAPDPAVRAQFRRQQFVKSERKTERAERRLARTIDFSQTFAEALSQMDPARFAGSAMEQTVGRIGERIERDLVATGVSPKEAKEMRAGREALLRSQVGAGREAPPPTLQEEAERAFILNKAKAEGTAAGTPEDAAGGPFEGTGFRNQAANQVLGIAPKIANGTANEEERAVYSIALAELQKPQLIPTPDGFRVAQMNLDPSLFPGAASGGGGVSTGGGGAGGLSVSGLIAEKGKPANEAGRRALISEGATAGTAVREAIIDPATGKVNRSLIATMSGNVPFTEGRAVRAQIERSLAAKLRLETGAQANEQEIQNLLDRFMPSILDDDKTVIDKLDSLVTFFNTALEEVDPTLARSLKARGGVEPPEDEPDAEFLGLTQDGVQVFERPDGSTFGVRP